MKMGYFRAIVVLLAVMCTCIISILRKSDAVYSLKVITIVIIVFFVIGSITGKIVEKTLVSKVSIATEKVLEVESLEQESMEQQKTTLGAETENTNSEEDVAPNE